MNIRSIALTALLTLSAGGAAFAQSVPGSAAGQFLYDPQGETLGSVVGLTDGGRTAVVRLGFIREPGSREITVPASALSVSNGRVTLRAETVEALNTRR